MMAFGKFADGASMFSTTPVENLFMLEFMPNAPGDFVRVYLYGLMTRSTIVRSSATAMPAWQRR